MRYLRNIYNYYIYSVIKRVATKYTSFYKTSVQYYSLVQKLLAKQRQGLSLIEVLFALVFVSVAIPGMLRLQTVLSRGVYNAHAFTNRLNYMRALFTQAARERWYEQDKTEQKTVDNPETTLVYTRQKLPESTALKNSKDIYIEQVQASWTDRFGKRTEQLVTLRFYPQPPSSKKP